MRLTLIVITSLFTAIISKTYAVEHIARKGETLSSIMRLYGIEPQWGPGKSVDTLLNANNEMLRQFPGSIEVGQVIQIPDELIETGATKTSKKIEIDFLEDIDKPKKTAVEVQNESEMEATVSALDASMEKQAEDFIKNTNTAENQSEKQDFLPLEPTPQPTPEKKKTESLMAEKIRQYSQTKVFSAHFLASPLISQHRTTFQTGTDKFTLKEDSGKGIQFQLQAKVFEKFLAKVSYQYQDITLEKIKAFELKQRSPSVQELNLSVGYKPFSIFGFQLVSGVKEGFVLYPIGNTLIASNSISPTMGAEVFLEGSYRNGKSKWNVTAGSFHIPRQQIERLVRKWGTRNSISASLSSKVFQNSFFKVQLGYDETIQHIDQYHQITSESSAAIGFGTELF